MAEPYVPVHAVTYEMTPDGPRIVSDQVVTAESDTRPKPEPEPEPEPVIARRMPRQVVVPENPPPAAPPAAAAKGE